MFSSICGSQKLSCPSAPDWRSLEISKRQDIITHMKCVTARNDWTKPEIFSNFGILDESPHHKWQGGSILPNDIIYCAPDKYARGIKIDTVNENVSYFGDFPSAYLSWLGTVYSPISQKIYAFPYLDNRVLVINPNNNDAISYIDTGSAVDLGLFGGGIQAWNGYIYGIPLSADYMLKINPANDTLIKIPGLPTDSLKWFGVNQASNGFLYFTPYGNSMTQVMKFDPETDTFTLFGNLTGGSKVLGAVITPNDTIYSAPFVANYVLKIDTKTDEISQIYYDELSDGTGSWGSLTLAANGKIYCPPYTASKMMVINPTNDEVSFIGDFPTTGPTDRIGKYVGILTSSNGCLYAIPHSARNVLKIDLGLNKPFDKNVNMSIYYNKF